MCVLGEAEFFSLPCCVCVCVGVKGVEVKMRRSPLLWRRGKGQMYVCSLCVLNMRSQVEEDTSGLE